MDNEIDREEVEEIEPKKEVEEKEEEPDYKTLYEKTKERNLQHRLEKQALKREINNLKEKPEVEEKKEELPTKSGLDNADYALLSVKGYEEEEDIEFIYKYMQKWGLPLRDVLKDEQLVGQLRERRQDRETRAAVPGSTKRSGVPMNSLELDLARYEKSGTLPQNFERRTAVINAKIEKESTNRPPWKR